MSTLLKIDMFLDEYSFIFRSRKMYLKIFNVNFLGSKSILTETRQPSLCRDFRKPMKQMVTWRQGA